MGEVLPAISHPVKSTSL